MRPALRSFVGFCLLFAASCASVPPPSPVGARPLDIAIRAEPQLLELGEPALRKIGKLIWRSGISMTGSSPNFGGWSDLHVSPDGRTLTTISDVGSWLRATIDYDSAGNLAGLDHARIGSLRGLDGKPLAGKLEADAEGMAHMPDGSWLVSFERNQRIWHYPTLDGVPVAINLPGDFTRQPDNGGVETLTVLADSRIVAISEDYSPVPGFLAGWIGRPDAEGHYSWKSFRYAKTPDFNPTSLAPLPDGGFVMLERAFDMAHGVRIRVMRLEAAELREGGTIRARELARLASPVTVDNLEGIAATRGPRGETLLWLMSDDNFNPLQRNLLLLFELEK